VAAISSPVGFPHSWPRRMRPVRLADKMYRLERAYRDWQAPPLHPSTAPPGFPARNL
jgi:hypothetical protein